MPHAGGDGFPHTPAGEPIVVVLARAPELGLVKSRLARDVGAAAALDVYRTLLACTARAVRAWQGHAVVHFSGSQAALAGSPLGWLPRLPQVDGSLARRLESALASALTGGCTAVAIGSDCPGLRARHLHELVALAGAHRVAFGPAADGGYWGIAVRDREALAICCAEDLPWSQPTLLHAVLARLAAHGVRAGLGATLGDVDDAEDARRARLTGALPPAAPLLTVVVPVRDDALALQGCLDGLRRCAGAAEVIVVDGGSSDQSRAIAVQHALQPRVLSARGGRDRQLAAAFAAARGDYVLCLPADARLPGGAIQALTAWLAVVRPRAGCLRRHAAARAPLHRWLDAWARLRAAWTGGAYMDQGPFFLRAAALRCGVPAAGPYDTAELGRRLAGPGRFTIAPVPMAVSCRAYAGGRTAAVTLRHQRLRLRHHLRTCFSQAVSHGGRAP